MNCRLCLIECTHRDSLFLFDKKRNNRTWTHLILKYLNVKIEENDNFSTHICEACFRQLSDFHSFFQLIEKQQLHLHDLLAARNASILNDFALVKVKTEVFEDEMLTEASNINFVNLDHSQHVKEAINAAKDVESIDNEDTLNDIDNLEKNEPMENSELYENNNEDTLTSLENEQNVRMSPDYLGQNDEVADRTCIVCYKVQKSFKSLQSHMYKMHNDARPYTCKHCGVQFRFRPNYKNHLAKCMSKGRSTNEDIAQRTCTICKKVHQTQLALQTHIYRYHRNGLEKPFHCTNCGFGFSSQKLLHRHLEKVNCSKIPKHFDTKILADKDQDRTCGICRREFKNVDTLSSHMYLTHKGAKPFACNACGLSFRMRGRLLRHFRNCKGTKPEENTKMNSSTLDSANVNSIEYRSCDWCSLVFEDTNSLYQHMIKEHDNV